MTQSATIHKFQVNPFAEPAPTALASAMAEAKTGGKKAKKGQQPAVDPTALPDLDGLIVARSTEEIAKDEQAAVARRQWVEGAAQKIGEFQTELDGLQAAIAKGVPTPAQLDRIDALKKAIKQLQEAGDEEVRKHLGFAKVLEEIRSADPNQGNAERYFAWAINSGRYREATEAERKAARNERKWPQGTIFCDGNMAVPNFSDQEKSGGQKAVESELVKFFRAYGQRAGAERKHGVDKIKEVGNTDLTGYAEGKTGVYALIFPPHKTERDQRMHPEGAMLVSVEQRQNPDQSVVIAARLVEVGGSRGNLQDLKGSWVPMSWVRVNRIPNTCPPEHRDGAERLVRFLRMGFGIWRANQAVQTVVTDPDPDTNA